MDEFDSLLETYCAAPGVSTAEYVGTDYAQSITDLCMEEFGKLSSLGYETHKDDYGNVYATREVDSNAPWVVLDAHMDEIGFIITEVDGNDLKMSARGGFNDSRTTGSPIAVYADDGLVKGTITGGYQNWVTGNYEATVTDGSGIQVGDVVVPDIAYKQEGDTYYSRCFDNRIGLAVLHTVALQTEHVDNVNIMLRGTACEEVGVGGPLNFEYTQQMQDNGIFVIAIDVADDGPSSPLGSGAIIADSDGFGISIDEVSKPIAQDAIDRTGMGKIIYYHGGTDMTGEVLKDSLDGELTIHGMTLGVPTSNVHNGHSGRGTFLPEKLVRHDVDEAITLTKDLVEHMADYQTELQTAIPTTPMNYEYNMLKNMTDKMVRKTKEIRKDRD